MNDKPFWSLHTHSKFSVNDALGSVAETVARAVELGYPALALTDHRSMSGSVQLYSECLGGRDCRRGRVRQRPRHRRRQRGPALRLEALIDPSAQVDRSAHRGRGWS